jgi:peptidoglycan/xylan/chitin deacetylase (PgdA/CDA1 family)
VVLTRVCSQSADPNGYATCTSGSGWIELADLNAFLDWMDQAGQNGGAPAGAALSTVRDAAISADTLAPVTTASCNGVACNSGTYTAAVYVALSSTDVGSAVASTHYTVDGSTPTLASPTYTTPIPITRTTTLEFRSWDHAGNAEQVRSLVVTADLPSDTDAPTTAILCDGQPCTTEGYNGSTQVSLVADDGTGWGVDATYYTTDGSTPTSSSTVYKGQFSLETAGTYTVQWFSTDLAGNTEPVHTQQIVVLPPKVVVSFTFDDADASQYSLAFQRALQPHGMHGTFYINTGALGSGPGFMAWPDVETMSRAGEDVGGHTVDHIDLTSSAYTQQQKVDEVCDDRQALLGHGIGATSFAYPFGAHDANAEAIAQGCGYSDARRTGGIALSGAPYAETIPPKDPYATITWTAPTPTTSPVQLTDMQNAVTTAAAHGGGWVQFVGHEICSQTYDPGDYSSCMGSFRPIELSTLVALMDWLDKAGQPGGAPPRTQVETVAQVIKGSP